MRMIPLKGGLDLASFPPPAGTLQDCLNFEVGLKDGYQKVQGFEPLACGHPGPAQGMIWFQNRLWTASATWSGLYSADGSQERDIVVGDWVVGDLSGSFGQREPIWYGKVTANNVRLEFIPSGKEFIGGSAPPENASAIYLATEIRVDGELDVPSVISDANKQAEVIAKVGDSYLIVYGTSFSSAFVFEQGDTLSDGTEVTYVSPGSVSGNPQGTITDLSSGGAVIGYCDGDNFLSLIDMGHQIQFKDGDIEPRSLYEGAEGEGDEDDVSAAAAALQYWNEGFFNGNIDWQGFDGGNVALDPALVEFNDARYIFCNRPENIKASSPRELSLNQFGFSLRPDNPILGLEVKVVAEWTGTASNAPWVSVAVVTNGELSFSRLLLAGEGIGSAENVFPKNQLVTATTGHDRDLWDNLTRPPTLTASSVSDPQFGLRLSFTNRTTVGTLELRIYQVEVTIHYQEGSSVLYFRNSGTDVATGRLVYAHVEDGVFDPPQGEPGASGTLTIQLDGTDIPVGSEIRTAAAGGGGLVGVTRSLAEACRLPAGGNIEMFASNFFASPDLEAVYGASGSGLPFTFTKDYFAFIRTGMKGAQARHVSRLKDRLAVAYDNGQIDLSVPAEPLMFGGALGAATLGVGERITGMLPLQGEVLAVFTERRIIGFYGADNDEFEERVLSPNSGAIEYTITDMGIPVFCDNRGIATLQTSDRFGDFAWGRMSYPVHPWLIPRLQADDETGVAGFVLARAKSQYRLFFKDGYVLTMTLKGDAAEFTIQRYTHKGQPVRFISATQGIERTPTGGRDRMFLSVANAAGIFELDKGLTFAGDPINCFLETQHWPGHENARFSALHLHGESATGMAGEVRIGTDYRNPAGQPVPVNMGQGRQFVQARVSAVGRTISARISNESEADVLLQGIAWADASQRRTER